MMLSLMQWRILKTSKIKIWEVRWQPFFDGQEALGDLIDQTDDLRGLLNSDAFLIRTAVLTVRWYCKFCL